MKKQNSGQLLVKAGTNLKVTTKEGKRISGIVTMDLYNHELNSLYMKSYDNKEQYVFSKDDLRSIEVIK